jgi:hypothetical protein
VPEFTWVELDASIAGELWDEFAADFAFDGGSPAFAEPAPSLTYVLPEAFRPVAQLVNDVLRACLEDWDSVFHHDGWHISSQYRPHRVTNIEDLSKWEYSHYPDGDYMIFVARDHGFGVLGDHRNHTICFFGEPAVRAVTELNRDVLTELVRRDGRAVR